MKIWIITALIAVIPVSADAMLCFRPDRPICLITLSGRDRSDFDYCRMAMERYRNEVRDYIACLRQEQDDATAEWNAALRKFNACATSDYC